MNIYTYIYTKDEGEKSMHMTRCSLLINNFLLSQRTTQKVVTVLKSTKIYNIFI